jgi:hypothetical protein
MVAVRVIGWWPGKAMMAWLMMNSAFMVSTVAA